MSKKTISPQYAFMLFVILSLCLASYPHCRLYSIIGLAVFLFVSLIFIRRLRGLAIGGALTLSITYVATLGDVLFHGPAIQFHNQRLARCVRSHKLIGESVDTVIATLGPPTSRFDNTNGESLNYAPFRYFPYGVFQVHCSAGKASSIELYDD